MWRILKSKKNQVQYPTLCAHAFHKKAHSPGAQSNVFTIFKNKELIRKILHRQSAFSTVEIVNFSIQKDHIHLCIQIPFREKYKAFVRAVTGLIARKITVGLWKFRPYTRIVEWGKDFAQLMGYFLVNEREVLEGNRSGAGMGLHNPFNRRSFLTEQQWRKFEDFILDRGPGFAVFL